MQIDILPYAKERIPDVINFEENLRRQENFWGWKIDQAYRENVEKSFCSPEFSHSISLLAYVEGKVVGRIDSSMIATHFEGSRQAYLDWVCVLKSHRHQGIAQKLMKSLREQLKQQGITILVGLIASNGEAQRFYRSLPDSKIQDEGIWIDIL